VRLSDVVNQFRLLLPKYTDVFSTRLIISNILVSGGNLTTIVTSTIHGLSTGMGVTISGVTTKTSISAVSQDGITFTFTTASDHDLTYGWEEHSSVTFEGFTDLAWNNSFILLDVPNRRTFKVRSTETLPILNTNEVLLENRADGVNGRFPITVVDTTSFTISGNFLNGVYTGGTIDTAVRIAGSVSYDRAKDQYTKQGLTQVWGFVVMNDPTVSKDRSNYSDATANFTTGTSIQTQVIDGFTLYIFINTKDQMAAEQAIDLARHTLFSPILKSVYGAVFPTGLTNETDYRTIMTAQGFIEYDRAVYSHVYAFELCMNLSDSDTVDVGNTSAFRDINWTNTVDEQDMAININLDTEPL